jgi:7-cyano-7-deazaguanine synthase
VKAVVLLSGGMDSAVALAVARDEGFETFALSFDYGQRHAVELDAAARVAKALGVTEHVVVAIDLSGFASSALTNRAIEVPKHALGAPGIPVTYVPARNTIFLAYAVGWAETLGASAIFIGANALDYEGYPDCRPTYLAAFERMANLGTKAGGKRQLRIHSPLVRLSKAEVIAKGIELGVDFALTHSCYDPDAERPCGTCDACLLRSRGFAEAGLPDPATAGAPCTG